MSDVPGLPVELEEPSLTFVRETVCEPREGEKSAFHRHDTNEIFAEDVLTKLAVARVPAPAA